MYCSGVRCQTSVDVYLRLVTAQGLDNSGPYVMSVCTSIASVSCFFGVSRDIVTCHTLQR